MRSAALLILLPLALTAIILCAIWAMNDASRRGKSPLLVLIAVMFFFPFGLLAWLLFRPDPGNGS